MLRTRTERVRRVINGVKCFCAWMVQDRRAADNPPSHLADGNVNLHRRHDRRARAEEELALLLGTALASPYTFRDLDGRDRHHVYLVAMTTGFRVRELAGMEPDPLDLDADPPTATLPPVLTKNKNGAVQPQPPEAAEALRSYLTGKTAGLSVWPGNWADNATDILRIDLYAAGIPTLSRGDGHL